MKRIIILFLVVLTLSMCLIGCTNKENSIDSKAETEMHERGTESKTGSRTETVNESQKPENIETRSNEDIALERDLIDTSWDLTLVYWEENSNYVNPKLHNIGEPYLGSVGDVDTHLIFKEDGSFYTSFGIKSILGTYSVENGIVSLCYDVYDIKSSEPIEKDVKNSLGIIYKKFPQFNEEVKVIEFDIFDHLNYYFDENEIIETSENNNFEVDTNKLYISDLIQQVGDDVYYCSSDGAPEHMGLPILDFSEVKPEYKKLPVDVEYGIQSFIVYDDTIYYICDYPNGQYTDSADTYGKLYKCDLQGNNQESIADYVNNLFFQIQDYNLTYSERQPNQKTTLYKYDIKNNQIVGTVEDNSFGEFRFTYIFRFEKSQGNKEFDGGYYYYEVIHSSGTESNKIDGHLANILFYREDIATGKVERIGYTFNQGMG